MSCEVDFSPQLKITMRVLPGPNSYNYIHLDFSSCKYNFNVNSLLIDLYKWLEVMYIFV